MELTSTTAKDFETVFRQHYGRLYSYANSILKDQENSEDVVQNIFIKIWENQKMSMDTESLRFYLFTAVRNNCLTILSKNRKNFMQELKEEDASYEMKIKLNPEENKTDIKSLVSNAMDQLPPKCREVFMLSRLSGQKYKEIAAILNISIKTVENQMSKAIKILKQFAKENGIYAVMLYLIFSELNTIQIVGVNIKNWFY